MLPHFVWQDFSDVIGDLQDSGIDFKKEWFAPHLEFRFPICGTTQFREVHMELRNALEPWNILGEEGILGGTVRYVDSSVERIQVKTTGMVGTRYEVLCNGIPVPMHPAGTVGEFVAGVRYRAWQPPNCSAPDDRRPRPLVFDLYDKWNGKTVAGCTYHVSHPGGRAHTTFPINSYEAESRRLARFFPGGHTPGTFTPPALDKSEEFPFLRSICGGFRAFNRAW